MSKSLFSLAIGLVAAAPLAGAPLPALADESVIVISRQYAAPGRERELQERFLKVIAYVRKAEPGYTYRLYHSRKDPAVFVFYEVYPSQAAFEHHAKVTFPAMRKDLGPPAEGIFARPAETETYTALTD
ncbi:MAG TPA: antibiotic biosynthesis monooxygenase family protein [Burkholderiales bacterium]|nr:antibiotic biosynthesis monooxygenase family protein [Burkholderiales bacterium]